MELASYKPAINDGQLSAVDSTGRHFPDTAIVTSHAVAHGWRAGIAAALGITLVDVLMTVIVSTGLGALVMSWTPAFDLLRWAGTCYLMWLAWQASRTPPVDTDAQATQASMRKIFARATLNSLLNPKPCCPSWYSHRSSQRARSFSTTQVLVISARKLAQVVFALLKGQSEYQPKAGEGFPSTIESPTVDRRGHRFCGNRHNKTHEGFFDENRSPATHFQAEAESLHDRAAQYRRRCPEPDGLA